MNAYIWSFIVSRCLVYLYLVVRCDTQVFIWIFQKVFIWLEGSDQIFFFKRTLTLKYFSLWQKKFLDSPKICLWPWEFLLFIWAQDKMFFIWENNFWKPFLGNCTMAFGKYFATFNYSFLPWHKCKSSLLTLPSPLDHDLHQIQQVEPPHVIISIQILFK